MSDEIVRELLIEGNENLDTLDRELLQLEKDPQNRATPASVFRTIHTIKGTCGFLGFTKREAVAHVSENLLSGLRDLELLLNPASACDTSAGWRCAASSEIQRCGLRGELRAGSAVGATRFAGRSGVPLPQ